MVSRLPLGICRTKAKIEGITVTSLAPRSMLRHRSSDSGVSGGISRSVDITVRVKGEKLSQSELAYSVSREVDELQEMLASGEYQMRGGDKE